MSRGKKIGAIMVKLKRNTGDYGTHPTFQVDLRFDTHTGLFHAQHDGRWYQAKTQDEIREEIRAAVERTIDVEWTRYLVIAYHAEVAEWDALTQRPAERNGSEIWGPDHDRAELAGVPGTRHYRPQAVYGLELRWSVIDFSAPFALPENRNKMVRLRREVTFHEGDPNEGEPSIVERLHDPREQSDDALPDTALPWTPEREEILRQILAALGHLDARLVELFNHPPDALAARIDAISDGGRLLMPGASPPPKGKGR